MGVGRSGGLNVRHVTVYSTLRWDDVALPCWPTALGQARRPLAPALGFRPQNFHLPAASEWKREEARSFPLTRLLAAGYASLAFDSLPPFLL